MVELKTGDALELLKDIPDKSVDMVLTDPPYNIGVKTTKNRKKKTCEWDRIDRYIEWCIRWIKECGRVLKDTGVFYFWHNDIAQVAELLCEIKKRTRLQFVSFCIWDKGDTYRAQSWLNRDPDGATAPRAWFNVCEFCLHFFNAPRDADRAWNVTGTERIMSNPACFAPLKKWYADEKRRLGLTDKDVAMKYEKVTGRKPYMLRHYWQDSQFEIPTKEVFETVYEPLGFVFGQGSGYEGLRRGYEGLRREYEGLRREYEGLRNVHNCDAAHCNVWHVRPLNSHNRFHTCQKPVELLERIVRVSSNPGGVVLDPFMGSGSTGVAAVNEGRSFIGFELSPDYFSAAAARIRCAGKKVAAGSKHRDGAKEVAEEKQQEFFNFGTKGGCADGA